MRAPTPYEEYLWRLRDYYRIKGLDKPAWIDTASEYYEILFDAGRDLYRQCSDTNIRKSTMEWLSRLEQSHLSDELPIELREGAKDCVTVLSEMYHTLTEEADKYFINQWTLNRQGRKKMREYLGILPSVSDIMPPKTSFTNVPLHLVFSNRFNWVHAEYELIVTLGGSRICIKNGDSDSRNAEYINFTVSFLDKIIPLMQWENLIPFLKRKNYDDIIDDSIYQDFSVIQVETNWYNYELNLHAVPEDNPFMKILRLVWDEYKTVFREKNMVLPWFKVLGWA